MGVQVRRDALEEELGERLHLVRGEQRRDLLPHRVLRRLAPEEGVGDLVQLAGFVPDDELHRLVNAATCVVIPSLYEPFGIVALEGMAAGAPTIVARTGGLAEIVEGTDAGLLFEPGNPYALADAVQTVVGDPVLAARLRADAADLLRRTYTWTAIADATVAVYRGALG